VTKIQVISLPKLIREREKKTITCLEHNGESLTDTKSMIDHATNFYKILFGIEPKQNISLDGEFWEEKDKVSEEENHLLEAEFCEEEILQAIKALYAEGAQALMVFLFSSTRHSSPSLKKISCL
jgi:hypothetical protein